MVGGEPGRDGLESDAVDEQVNDGGVGPQGDREPGPGGAEPELLPADGEVARGGNEAGDLHGQADIVAAWHWRGCDGGRRLTQAPAVAQAANWCIAAACGGSPGQRQQCSLCETAACTLVVALQMTRSVSTMPSRSLFSFVTAPR